MNMPSIGQLPDALKFAHLAAIFESSEDAIISATPAGTITSWSPGAARLYGYSAREAIGRSIFSLSPLDRQHDLCDVIDRIESGERVARARLLRVRSDGISIPVCVTAAPIRSQDGELIAVSLIEADLSIGKMAEQAISQLNQTFEERFSQYTRDLEIANNELQRRTAELEALNREIEAFSYSVSHDLRAPLRSMAGFSHALCEDYSNKLDETGRNFLLRIRAASERMGLLIDDLLALSRVSRGPLIKEEVDLAEIVCSILSALKEREPIRTVETVVAREARTAGDPRLLQILLDNLIGNAWKFTAKTTKPRIEFGIEAIEGERAFFVRDNGAGFDPRFAGKLFGAFQRLHSEADYPGTGIGLATVQRIAHRHGGRVWADGRPDEGAAFYFTIGRAEKEASGAGG